MPKYDHSYNSKMREIIIPLLGFKGFHHTNNDSDVSEGLDEFIGRKSILDKLQSWLKDDSKTKRKYSGAYLITGFRGMGKSSFVHKAIKNLIKQTKQEKGKFDYIPISINVGNDLLTSKELLYLICKLLSAKFDKETRIQENFKGRINVFIFQASAFILSVACLCNAFFNGPAQNPSTSVIEEWLLSFKYYSSWIILSSLFLVLCLTANRIYYKIWKLTNWRHFITVWQIKRELMHLEERIDCETTLSRESEFNVSTTYRTDTTLDNATSNIGYRNLSSKKNLYPIANTPEIQDLLVNILNLIKKLPGTYFRFIFVIDELDKVSPEDNEKQIVPEYDSTNVVNGNSTYRSRQKALASLLANMKYFISSSDAKFIFITGYDMYEAYLADISNREFNLHSIFNGHINVSSFFRTAGNSKGADSMIEEYLCHALLNENKNPNRRDLHDLSNYYMNAWDETQKNKYEKSLERRVIFLRHFLTYLFYMSNGSPKKLAIYLEKYIRSKARILEKCCDTDNSNHNVGLEDICLGVSSDQQCEWFLYFDVRNIQKIEFINYIIYPMIKNLIAKSSIYNDKLLVSTSFMISNLYKFHKSGFSLRNLEYMPELLDINKTPELRDFIGGILQFLNQTHIDEAVVNLYKFKFPLRLSEEITFFSKKAEETSYLFNFSHDELLSIKKLYNQQLTHYTKNHYESPAVASVRHMLGDIYMLEENYEQAIFEFNEARNAIYRQVGNNNPKQSADNILFLVRLSLKLGLAYEKRKTFDTAYVTYENLVKQILSEARTAKFYGNESRQTSNILVVLNSKSSFFVNIRIVYLGLLAKLSVLEKMDLGGIREKDLVLLYTEFEQIYKITTNELRPVTIIDFFTKLGDILYFKGCSNRDWVQLARQYLYYINNNIITSCTDCSRKKLISIRQSKDSEKNKALPCSACLHYRISIEQCLLNFNSPIKQLADDQKALHLWNLLHNEQSQSEILKKGNVFIMSMANALVGIGNTLFGCSGGSVGSLNDFFRQINNCFSFRKDKCNTKRTGLEISDLDTFKQSILYYLSAAKTYELLTDHKSAYNIYVQILDAISTNYRINNQQPISNDVLKFCEELTKKAIYCTYWHYDNINCAEIDTIKHELSHKNIGQISLQYLSSYPEIEVAVYKYYGICLMGDRFAKDRILAQVLNSRQLSQNRLVATLTQNIQNLYFKVLVNEAVLSLIMPDLYISLITEQHSLANSIEYIAEYYNSTITLELLHQLNWHILDGVNGVSEKNFCMLDYLLKDSLFCLNRITELIAPLYSTTLYNNAFIGEIYERTFYWNHILICMREIFEFTESTNKKRFISNLKSRNYIPNIEIEIQLEQCSATLSNLKSWKEYNPEEKDRVSTLYEQVCPNNNYYLTSTYLTGNAIDFYNRALEMHSSGKSYKEMMTTLFFLEDDLHNDSNYLNFANEIFLINTNYINQKIDALNKFSLYQSHLLDINSYVETKH